MTAVLVRKLLRDMRVAFLVVALLLGSFQCFWAQITKRIVGQLAPFFHYLAGLGGLTDKDIQAVVFDGPGRIVKTLIGGDAINLNGVMDMLSIGYVHPLIQTIFCIWAVGRAAGAVAGETDRGTAELLLAQPMPRSRLILAHLWVDLITIPLLTLSLWAGTCVGHWLTGPVKIETPKLKTTLPQTAYELGFGPFKMTVRPLTGQKLPEMSGEITAKESKRLEVRLWDFAPAMLPVGGLLFAMSGYTMWFSSVGRFRWRVLGLAVLVTLLQFLINLIGQMWDLAAPLRPFTIFYYYQPQQFILGTGWDVGALLVLYSVGAVGYLLAFYSLKRRDIPAPL
jgi:ABC-2 type transport system permease protein